MCGAWHVPALDVDAHTVSADTATLRGLRRTKVGTAWVPWTHRRLTRALGYEAGVDSPGWYRHVFGHPGRDGPKGTWREGTSARLRGGSFPVALQSDSALMVSSPRFDKFESGRGR